MASISVSKKQFSCTVCLHLLKDPVTLPCGHSFCKVCINDCWDQEDQKGVYSCPQCRDTFTPRPVLHSNKMLADLAEKLKKIDARHPLPPPRLGDVECDYCDGRKCKAIKSCLTCRTSFCEIHLKPHLERPALQTHSIIKATKILQEKICSQHNKPMEIYCCTDRTCICYLCTMDIHKGHNTVTAAAERAEKQSTLKEVQIKNHQRIQEKQKTVQELKQTISTIKLRTQRAVDDSERIFTELISSMEKKRSEVTELIRAQEEAELSRAERLLEQLEQEIADLQRRLTELEQLSYSHDHVHFLQTVDSALQSSSSESRNIRRASITHIISFDGLKHSLSAMQKRHEEFCEKEFHKISPHADIVPELKNRDEFLQYYCALTLDPNTAHRSLILSEKNRALTRSERMQQYSDHPERFDYWPQVLCKERVSGRCYWEVERSRWGGMDISVSYKGINRKGQGNECRFGHNDQSWSLWCSSSSLYFYHNNIKTTFNLPSSSRIGVYVDHSAGTLSFYSVSDTMKLLHSVHTTFTQPLYAGFGLCFPSTIKLCIPK